ncbi:MAG: hypothetical protein ABIP58_05675 [Dehalococcoidia bacterium]
MNSLIDHVIRVASWSCVFLLAAIAGWLFGGGGIASGDHQLLSIATSVVAGLAVMTAVVPARNPNGRPSLGTGDRAPINVPPIGSVPGYAHEPSHVHIPRRGLRE